MIPLITPGQSVDVPFDPSRLDEMADADIDALPFGVIGVDLEGVVFRYNQYESRLARLDRTQVLGRNFFTEVGHCTDVPEFAGRFRDFAARPAAAPAPSFDFLFDFRFGAQKVFVEMVRGGGADRFYLLINRRQFLPPRTDLPPDVPAPLQRELAPHELDDGVRRDTNETRAVEVKANFFVSLRATWSRIAPQGWPLFCSEWGQQWGRLAVVDLETAALERRGTSLRELPLGEVIGSLAEYLHRQGWGRLVGDFSAARDGAFVLTLERNALAEAIGHSEGPCCYLMAGFFGAIFNHLAGRLLAVEEAACHAQGHPHCAFVVVSRERQEVLEAASKRSAGDVRAVLSALREANHDGR